MSPLTTIDKFVPAEKEENVPVPCNCRRSKCLKLYCDCFKTKKYCEGCNCVNCCNTKNNEKERQDAIKSTLERDPTSFDVKNLFI